MEETGLSKQLPERESSDGYTNQDQFDPAFSSTGDNDNFEQNANINDMRYSYESTTKNMNNIPSQKKSTLDIIKEKIPPLPLLRVSVKASIAILISFIFVLNGRCRAAMGAAILVPIGTIFSFPVRPIGVQAEACIYNAFTALCSAAWCFLTMYLANLARDPNNPNPVQPNSSAVLAIFMLIGVFGLTYLRTKFAQANFPVIFGCMIINFSLTQASITPGFQPAIIYTFLTPLATSCAISLAVDVFIWPEDSVSKILGILSGTLKDYNSFFQEHSNAFLSTSSEVPPSLSLMHARLRNSIFKLLDSKREVERELIYNKLSHGDMCKMATITKDMRLPLHGIGLSQVIKSELLKEMSDPFENKEPKEMDKKRELLVIVEEMRVVSLELSKTCVSTLSNCSDTILKYSVSPRSWKSTIFWPFPRISLSRFKNKTDDLNLETCQHLAQRLENDIARFEEKSKHTSYMLSNLSIKEYQEQFEGPVQNILLFHFSIMEFANKLHSLVKFIEEVDTTRKTCRFWFPKLSFRKWFRSNGMNPTVGVNLSSGPADPGRSAKNTGSFDMTVSQTMVETGSREFSDDTDLVGSCDQRGIIYPRDPDVNPPETILERFFYHVYRIFKWCQSMEVFFSLKCSAGFVLLSLMALLPQSANWFFQWQGAWSTNSQMTWMIPLAGMFFTTVFLRVIGTVLGGVLGIVVWEISRGNPYGLGVLSFFVMVPFYYLFFTSKTLNIFAITTQITLFLVLCTEYQYKVSGTTGYDSVEIVAGKGILLVVIGVIAAAILTIYPKPVTGRVELRKRISKTIHDMSKLYGILVGDLLIGCTLNDQLTERQENDFNKLAVGIRRQIADERTYLNMTKIEPPLRGKFPLEIYSKLVEKVDNMADLLESMSYASRFVDKSWQRGLISVIKEEKMEHLASILTMMKLLAATLASKMPMPPFMISPLEESKKFSKKLRNAISTYPEEINRKTFPSYCAYAVNSYKFCGELHEVMNCIEKLVGIEDPEQWLRLHA